MVGLVCTPICLDFSKKPIFFFFFVQLHRIGQFGSCVTQECTCYLTRPPFPMVAAHHREVAFSALLMVPVSCSHELR